jgi:hypothetical protein
MHDCASIAKRTPQEIPLAGVTLVGGYIAFVVAHLI